MSGVEHRDDAGRHSGRAGELLLELLEHNSKTEGHTVRYHVGQEGGSHNHPAEASVRSHEVVSVDADTVGTARHGEVGRVLRKCSVTSLLLQRTPLVKAW